MVRKREGEATRGFRKLLGWQKADQLAGSCSALALLSAELKLCSYEPKAIGQV